MKKICGCPFPCEGAVEFDGNSGMSVCLKCGAVVYDTNYEGRLEIIDEHVGNNIATMEIAQVVDYEQRSKCPSFPGGPVIFGVRKMKLQRE